MAAFESSERIFIDLLDFENYKNDKNLHTNFYQQQFEYDLIRNIPSQIEKYFEMCKFELEQEDFTNEKIDEALAKSKVTGNRRASVQRRASVLAAG
jgi:hypothetical protein